MSAKLVIAKYVWIHKHMHDKGDPCLTLYVYLSVLLIFIYYSLHHHNIHSFSAYFLADHA